MRLPIALIDELERHYTESGGATMTAAEFRALAEAHGVSDADIRQIVGRTERVEELIAKFEQSQSLVDLRDLLELFPDGAEQFAALANQLTQELLPDPAAGLH